jgi:hypothetical protein
MARIFLLYSIVGIESGYQYGLSREAIRTYDLELFASPFNHTLPKYCSLFYNEVDKLFGSIGQFPEVLDVYKNLPLKIQANPPFINEIQDSLARYAIKYVEDAAKNNLEVVFLITMGNWTDSIAYQLLSTSRYLCRGTTMSKFVDRSSNTVMTLKSRAITFELRSI